MPIRKSLFNLAKQYWKWLVASAAGVAALFGLVPLVDLLRTLIATDIEKIDAQHYRISMLWGWAVLVLLLLAVAGCVIGFILSLQVSSLKREISVRLDSLGADTAKKLELAHKTLQGMMRAATRITNQLYPPKKSPPYAFERISRVYTIDSDGSATLSASYHIRAYRRALHFWSIGILAETDAPAIEFLDEIDFKVRDETKADRVAYLLKTDTGHEKEISIFFLPEIDPREAARKIAFRYTWPRMLERLLTKGDEDFSLRLDSRTTVGEFEYAAYFHPGLFKTFEITCEQLGTKADNETLLEAERDGWRGWCYKVTDAPAQGAEYTLRFKAVKKQ